MANIMATYESANAAIGSTMQGDYYVDLTANKVSIPTTGRRFPFLYIFIFCFLVEQFLRKLS